MMSKIRWLILGDITSYFHTPAGPAKDAKLDRLYVKYWLIAKESVECWLESGVVTVLVRPGVEKVKARAQ